MDIGWHITSLHFPFDSRRKSIRVGAIAFGRDGELATVSWDGTRQSLIDGPQGVQRGFLCF